MRLRAGGPRALASRVLSRAIFLGGEKREGVRFDPQQVRLGDKRRGARRLVDFSANRSSVTHAIVGGEQDVLAPTN